MIESSKDLLYIVIAFCILWFTIVICWMIYYIAMILREAYKTVKDIHEKINRVEVFFQILREKLEHSSYHLALLVEGIRKLIDVYNKKKVSGKKK